MRWTREQHHKAASLLRSAAEAEPHPSRKAGLMAQAANAEAIAQQMPGAQPMAPVQNPNEIPDLPPDVLAALGIAPPQQ